MRLSLSGFISIRTAGEYAHRVAQSNHFMIILNERGLWQMVKCRNCTKEWEVSLDEEEHLDFGRNMFTVKCTECDYQTKKQKSKAVS